jgi:hypothetical protein
MSTSEVVRQLIEDYLATHGVRLAVPDGGATASAG